MAKKQLKIAFLSFYSGTVARGVESFVHDLSNRLVSMGHEVSVYQEGPQLQDIQYKTIRVSSDMTWDHKDATGTMARRFYFDHYSRKIKDFSKKAIKKMSGEKFDVVIPMNGALQPLYVKRAAKKNRWKVVVIGQSGMGWDERIGLYSMPDVFVPLSEKAYHWARKTNPFVKAVKIPNAVDITKFKPEGQRYKTKLEKPLVVSVGAYNAQKRHELVIDAVSRLKEVSLLVVGDGDLKEKYQRMLNDDMKERTEFVSLPFSEMPMAFRSGDVFTLASTESEAFGIVFVEAMASGLPVVANNDPIRREIVGDAGLFVDPTDTGAYAQALTKALEKKWGQAPRKQAEKFSWELIAQKYEKLFVDLVS